jgi:hypothetical protein
MTAVKPPILHIDQKRYYLEAPPRAMKFPPSWLPYPSGEGGSSTAPRKAKKEGGQGGGAP